MNEQVRPEGRDLRFHSLGRGEPHVREAGTVALHGEGHGLAVHPRREGGEHAYHASQRSSLGYGRSASGRKWPEVCRAKALGRQPCAPNFRELRHGEVRAEGRASKVGNRRDRGNCTGGYSASTNSSKGTPYALAIFVTVGM